MTNLVTNHILLVDKKFEASSVGSVRKQRRAHLHRADLDATSLVGTAFVHATTTGVSTSHCTIQF
jgi:hypothetical protein